MSLSWAGHSVAAVTEKDPHSFHSTCHPHLALIEPPLPSFQQSFLMGPVLHTVESNIHPDFSTPFNPADPIHHLETFSATFLPASPALFLSLLSWLLLPPSSVRLWSSQAWSRPLPCCSPHNLIDRHEANTAHRLATLSSSELPTRST